MKLRDVNQNKRIAKLWFTGGRGKSKSDEKDLIAEAFDRLIQKQEKMMDTTNSNRDAIEKGKLEKYKMDKMLLNRMDIKHEPKEVEEDVFVEEPEDHNQVTKTMLYDIINALNENIKDLRRDGTWNTKNSEKFTKLKHLLNESQELKTHFERVRPKPRGWGYLKR